MTYNPFFIIGAQRSGTTLLRLMLNAHSHIAIPEEATFWMPLLRKAGTDYLINQKLREQYLSYILTSEQFKLWCFQAQEYADEIREIPELPLSLFISKLYEGYAASQNKKRWGDKTPSFFRMIPSLHRLFPKARFIHIIRDGRDVCVSWRNIDSSKRNISTLALEWKMKVQKIQKSLSRLDPAHYMKVRYEDLTAEPGKYLKNICDFLELPFEVTILDFWKTSDKYIGKHHSQLIFQPISTASVGKWKKKLLPGQVRRFEIIAGKLLRSLGYETGTPQSTSHTSGSKAEDTRNQKDVGKGGVIQCITSVCTVMIDLCFGVPFRIIQVGLNRINAFLAANFGLRILKEKAGERPVGQLHQKEDES